ncbi:MAG TPA: GxxExxY protein [Chryseolinea sp.]|nr:GxxExxY protein [Chryseolinea sp.]
MKTELQATRDKLNDMSKIVVASAIEMHRHMGPGLLESIYQHCMVTELRSTGICVDQLVPVVLHDKSTALDKMFLIDMLVENEIVLELKAVEGFASVHEAQLLSYLRLADKRLRFLINFNVLLLKEGLKRMVTSKKP